MELGPIKRRGLSYVLEMDGYGRLEVRTHAASGAPAHHQADDVRPVENHLNFGRLIILLVWWI
jgi:hypothetical protein